MKKTILIVLSVLSFVSCSEEQRNKFREAKITLTDEWWYKGHHYLKLKSSLSSSSIIHDPNCPCHLDTLSIYVVENNDTTYVIRK